MRLATEIIRTVFGLPISPIFSFGSSPLSRPQKRLEKMPETHVLLAHHILQCGAVFKIYNSFTELAFGDVQIP
jgi:hypothetical protein